MKAVRAVAPLVLAASLLPAWAAGQVPDAGGAHAPASRASMAPLDVPFVSQAPALCGGAAVAMVLRYWGRRGVHAEDFAELVERAAEGIRTSVLADAVRQRGWRALPFSGTVDDLRTHAGQGRPVIALIDAGRGLFHYVVVTGAAGDRIVFHDPAVGPAKTLGLDAFDVRWTAAQRWAMLVLPDGGSTEPDAVGPEAARTPDACTPLVAEAVAQARGGDAAAAEERLRDAQRQCPASSAPWVELAGLRFLQKDWRAAAALAEQGTRLDPADEHAWRLLASSLFLAGERTRALDAWNRVGEPRLDLVRIDGLRRTRYRLVESWLGLSPREPVTNAALTRARRRLAALPSAGMAHLEYRPVGRGLAEVHATVLERRAFPSDIPSAVGTGLRAAVSSELAIGIAAPAGAGDLWEFSWRWWEARPRVEGAVSLPGAGPVPGLLRAGGVWERQTYRMDPSDLAAPRVEARRGVFVSLGDWRLDGTRWELEAGVDRWDGRGAAPSLGAGFERRLADDRLSAGVFVKGWAPGRRRAFGSAEARAAWRSSARPARWALASTLTWQAALGDAPLGLWPGAGTGQGRSPLLRAHPLLRHGVIAGPMFGRRLLAGSVEGQRWVRPGSLPARFAVAVFADAARVSEPLPHDSGPPADVDVGGGLRLAIPGSPGVLRLDAAVGVRDGRRAVSAAWQLPWGERSRR